MGIVRIKKIMSSPNALSLFVMPERINRASSASGISRFPIETFGNDKVEAFGNDKLGIHSGTTKNSGASLIEYIVLMIIILSAFLIMQQLIQNGLFAKHKQAGEAFGFGRQYDAKRTTVCKQDVLSYDTDGNPVMGPLYDEDCFQVRVMRKSIFIGGTSMWDTLNGGCPQCDPGDTNCFACEDAIKNSCQNEYCKQ